MGIYSTSFCTGARCGWVSVRAGRIHGGREVIVRDAGGGGGGGGGWGGGGGGGGEGG